ncbi:EamA family transporter [bacterium]|nr:EamA family transporter [bacterium]
MNYLGLKKLFKINQRVLIGSFAVMLAALFWSLDGVLIRPKFYILPAGLVVFLEHFFGFIILSPFLFLNWYKIKNLSKKSWGAILWVCIFGGLLGTLMITKAFFAAMDGETTFSTVIILQKLQPIFALILARIILKEKLSKKFYLWAFLAIIAAYFLAFGHINILEVNILHNAAIFALIAAFSFGSSTVFGKRIVNHLDFKMTSALRFGITSVLALVLILFTGDFFVISLVTPLQWKLLIVIVFTSGAGAIFIYYFGLKRISASTATICELFFPFSAVILDYILNKNVLNSVQIVSAIVLLIAFYYAVREGKMKSKIFEAKVIQGEGRGKKIGFPTANLDIVNLDISHGVYSVNVFIGEDKYKGLLHFGYKETFYGEISAEVFIKNFDKEIYKENVKIEIISRIREIKKFKDSGDLRKQIEKDLKYIN